MAKKILSFVLATVLLMSCIPLTFSASAKGKGETVPLVVVSGFATVPLYLHADTPEAEQVFAPSSKRIAKHVSALLLPLMRFSVTNDWDRLADEANPHLAAIFEQSLCDENGNSVLDVGVRTFPESADHYMDFFTQDERDEHGFVHAAVDKLGEGNVFFFSYDWRLDPMDHADALNKFIRNVKKQTGKDKIVLAACSMGGAITLAYLSKYGASDLKTLIMDNTAFQGISVVGRMFCQDYDTDTDTIIDYSFQFGSMAPWIKNTLTKYLKRSCLTERLGDFLIKMSAHNGKRIAEEVMYPVFGKMPGFWVFVPDKDYETAKSYVLDKEKNEELIRKIDRYHYSVQKKAKKILKKAMNEGCNLFILVNYGKYGIPVSTARMNCNDYLIDTSLSSGGAVCASNGQTLPKGYVQKVDCGHDHLSPDGRIDASTCMFPEITWFVRDMGHLDYPYGGDGADFLMWFVCANKQYNVRSDPRYPQFLKYDKLTKKLSPQ